MVTAFFLCQARAPTGTCVTCKIDWIGEHSLTKSYIIRDGLSYREDKGGLHIHNRAQDITNSC